MKKVVCALALMCSSAFAQTASINLPIRCDSYNKVLDLLLVDFKESITWLGQDSDITYLLFTNKNKNSWTIVLTDKKVMCVVASGTGQTLTTPI